MVESKHEGGAFMPRAARKKSLTGVYHNTAGTVLAVDGIGADLSNWTTQKNRPPVLCHHLMHWGINDEWIDVSY